MSTAKTQGRGCNTPTPTPLYHGGGISLRVNPSVGQREKYIYYIFLISLLSLTFTIFLHLLPHITLPSVLILAVRITHVIHYPSIWPNSPSASCRSVVGASDRCTEGHRFESCRGFVFFAARDVANITSFYKCTCYELNLPTLISNGFSLIPQQSPRLTIYNSITGSTCPRSTLHQGLVSLFVCVHKWP